MAERKLIVMNLDAKHPEDKELEESIDRFEQPDQHHRMILALKKAKVAFTSRRVKLMEMFETNLDEVRTQKLAKGKLNVAFKSLRQNDAALMLYLTEKRKDHTGEVT